MTGAVHTSFGSIFIYGKVLYITFLNTSTGKLVFATKRHRLNDDTLSIHTKMTIKS